jgi:hypothetical protein
MHVFVDVEDVKSIEAYLSVGKHNATIRILDGFGPVSKVDMHYLGGYILQDWLKIWADYYLQLTGARYVMFLDTDVVFTLPISRSTLFDKFGKPYLAGWDLRNQPHLHAPCYSLLGSLCDLNNSLSYMTFYPTVIPIEVLQPLRNHIVYTRNCSAYLHNNNNDSSCDYTRFDEVFLDWAMHPRSRFKNFAQFLLMGNFIKNKRPDVSHLLYTPNLDELTDDMEVRYWLPSAIHHWFFFLLIFFF